jgi:hypothetical protein
VETRQNFRCAFDVLLTADGFLRKMLKKFNNIAGNLQNIAASPQASVQLQEIVLSALLIKVDFLLFASLIVYHDIY